MTTILSLIRPIRKTLQAILQAENKHKDAHLHALHTCVETSFCPAVNPKHEKKSYYTVSGKSGPPKHVKITL